MGWPSAIAGERVGEIDLGIDAVRFCGLQEGGDLGWGNRA